MIQFTQFTPYKKNSFGYIDSTKRHFLELWGYCISKLERPVAPEFLIYGHVERCVMFVVFLSSYIRYVLIMIILYSNFVLSIYCLLNIWGCA